MTIALRAAGTPTGATDAVTAVNPAVPAGAVLGDISVLTVVVKPYNTVLTTPSGWTKIGEHTNGTTASGIDVGSTKVAVYVKENAAVGAIGAIGQDIANTMGAVINVYSKTLSSWNLVFTQGFDSTNGANYSATASAGVAVATGDWVIASTAINGDIGTVTAFAIGGMAGATLGTAVQRTNSAVTTGNDCRILTGDIPITAGSSTAAPTHTYTNASSTSGTTMWLRIREEKISNVVREKVTTGNDADTITAGNTGSSSVVQTGGSAEIDTAVVYSATRAILGNATVTSGAVYWELIIPQVDSGAFDFYIRINTMPSAEIGVLSILNASTRMLSVNVCSGADAGKIRVRDAGGAGGLNLYTSTAAMSTGVWYRVSIYATQHVTAGTVRVAFFTGNGSTPLDDSTLLTGKATGASPYNRLRWGPKTGTGTATFNAAFDDWAYDLGATDLIAPEVTNVDYVKNPADSVGITDTGLDQVVDFVWTSADPVGITDVAARAATIDRAPTDPVGITDSRAITADRTPSDPVGITDSAARLSTSDRAPADPVGITDSATTTITGDRAAPDAVGITDAVRIDTSRAPADPVGITDAAAVIVGGTRSPADPVGITDVVDAQILGSGVAVDPATLVLAGQDPSLAGSGGVSIAADVAALVLAGQDLPLVAGPLAIVVDTAILSLTGPTPPLSATGTAAVSVDVAALTLSGQDSSLAGTGAGAVTLDVATLLLTGLTSAASGGGTASIAGDTALLSLAGQDPALAGVGVATAVVDSALLTLSGQTGSLSGGPIIASVDTALLVLGGQNAVLAPSSAAVVALDVAALTLVAQTPVLVGAGAVSLVPGSAALVLAGQTPVLSPAFENLPAKLSLSASTPYRGLSASAPVYRLEEDPT
jgi:hypothetical protein